MIINSNNTNTNTTSARRRASRASSPAAAAAAALFLLACIAPAPCDAQSVVQQVRRAFSSAGGRTLTQDDPAARGFKRPSYREKYKPKPTPKPTPNKCSGNVIKCKEDTTCEKKFPCFNSFCDFGDGHRGKDSWKRTNWKYKPDKPRHGVCACEDKKKNNHECIVPGGGAKCTGPFGKCSYEGQCVPDDRDDGCPCDGNVADAVACGLDPLTPCVDPSQPCKCNGTGSCVPNYIDGLACPKTDSMGVCDSPTTGKCNAAGVCESVSVPGLACDPDDTPNLCISNTSGTCDDTGRFCTADVLEDGCPCTPADYTTVDKTVDCNGDGNTVSTECLDKTNPCNCELHDGITCVPNYIDGLACDSPATPGVCDSPTTGKCNADGVCESVSVPGLACDPENTPNLCISNTSGTCDDTGLLCTADVLEDGCPCTPADYTTVDTNVDCNGDGTTVPTECLDKTNPCNCEPSGDGITCVPNYIDGLACPKTDSMGVCDSPTTGKCNADGVCESVSVPGLACDPDDTANQCISNTSGTCSSSGVCEALLNDGFACTGDGTGHVDDPITCPEVGVCADGTCFDLRCPVPPDNECTMAVVGASCEEGSGICCDTPAGRVCIDGNTCPCFPDNFGDTCFFEGNNTGGTCCANLLASGGMTSYTCQDAPHGICPCGTADDCGDENSGFTCCLDLSGGPSGPLICKPSGDCPVTPCFLSNIGGTGCNVKYGICSSDAGCGDTCGSLTCGIDTHGKGAACKDGTAIVGTPPAICAAANQGSKPCGTSLGGRNDCAMGTCCICQKPGNGPAQNEGCQPTTATAALDAIIGARSTIIADSDTRTGALIDSVSSAPRPSTADNGSGALESNTAARTERGDVQQVAQRPAAARARAASSAGVYDASTQQQQRPKPREP